MQWTGLPATLKKGLQQRWGRLEQGCGSTRLRGTELQGGAKGPHVTPGLSAETQQQPDSGAGGPVSTGGHQGRSRARWAASQQVDVQPYCVCWRRPLDRPGRTAIKLPGLLLGSVSGRVRHTRPASSACQRDRQPEAALSTLTTRGQSLSPLTLVLLD